MYHLLMDDPTVFVNDFIRYPNIYWHRLFDLQCWRVVEWIVVSGHKSWNNVHWVEKNIVGRAFRAYSAARRIQRAWRHHQRNRLYMRMLWALTRSEHALSPEIARVVVECSHQGGCWPKGPFNV
jgi:hypothetical protein